MTPKFRSTPIQNRLDLYVMGLILIVVLAFAAQVLNPRTQTLAESDIEYGRLIQNAPETGN